MIKIRLVDATIYDVMRAEIVDGHLEIDFKNKSAEEVQEIVSHPQNLSQIDLLTESGAKYGDLINWTKRAGVMLNGDIKTAILTQAIDATEQRLTNAESNALSAKTMVEELKEEGIAPANYGAVFTMAKMNAEGITDDEQALQVKALYDNWSGDSVKYKTGKYLLYNDVLYKVLKDHTSQETWTPDTASSLYAKVLADPSGEILPWEQPAATNGYMKGDKVTHKGKTWESETDDNVWEPGAEGAPWKEVEE